LARVKRLLRIDPGAVVAEVLRDKGSPGGLLGTGIPLPRLKSIGAINFVKLETKIIFRNKKIRKKGFRFTNDYTS
jgi:hypothetical protein